MTIKRLSLVLAFILYALAVSARAQTPEAEAPAPQETLAPTGSGVAGKIPKWTTSTNLGNSVMTENTGRIGINVSPPSARLHVFGATPAAKATSGTHAMPLLLTTGGRGGNTTGTTGQFAGNGADIRLVAGRGGDAPALSYRGRGGSIILEPGAHGTGVNGYDGGNILLDPSGVGKVGIGTSDPLYSLDVVDGGAGTAVRARSASGVGVTGTSSSSYGVHGSSGYVGVYGVSLSGTGVGGKSAGGYAGYFEGKARVTGNLQVASCTGCTIASDHNLKANVSAVDPRSVLDRLARLPIKAWNYQSDSPSVRHLGPMAQDFRSAFQLGADDKHIDMIDASGVALASVQALYQLMLEKDKQIERQASRLAALTRTVEQQGQRNEQLQAQLNQVKRAVRGRRAAMR